MDADDITLYKTCDACPEQYEALGPDGNQIGYLRLRHGSFTVECPDCGGKLVYSGEPDGDGIFEDYERETYLSAAKVAIANYYRGSTPLYFCR